MGKQNIIPCFVRRVLIDSVANGWAHSNRPLLQGLQIANASRRTLSLPHPDVSTEKARKKKNKKRNCKGALCDIKRKKNTKLKRKR